MVTWLESVPAAQVALLMVSLQQIVLGLGWASAAAMMGPHRAGALWAASYALASGAGIGAFVIAIGFGIEGLRVAGNLSALLAMIGLHRAARAFMGQAQPDRAHGLLTLGVVLLFAALWFGVRQDPLRIALASGVVVGLALWTAADAWAFARRELSPRWALLFAVPLTFTALAFAVRAARALAHWGQPMYELVANDSSRVGLATVTMVAALAVQVTLVALLVARQFLDQRRNAQRDMLTALPNRQAMSELLQAEVQRARRLEAPFSVLLIDADHFKQINDRHGHAGGDRVLQHLSGVMNGTLRDIDRLGRWGGEEFVALLPATPVDAARVLAERLRERVAASPAPWAGGLVPLTVSLGAAQWQPGDDVQAVLQRADQALYRAKRAGRNQVAAG